MREMIATTPVANTQTSGSMSMPSWTENLASRQDACRPFADDEARWEAVLARDAVADGAFYYGVRSTKIFCRPSCPARRPHRASVTYFTDPAAAEEAGYRACLRCRPTELTTQQHAVAYARQLLERPPAPSLHALADAVGFSPFHFQRIFKRATGLTPKQYAVALRTDRLKSELNRRGTVTRAMIEAGFGSETALRAAAQSELGMSAKRYASGGRGEDIAYGLTDSAIGTILVAATARGLCAVKIGSEADVVPELRAELARATLRQDEEAVAPYLEAVRERAAGLANQDPPLDLRGTPFQQKVWAALRAIPYGETRTYGEIARLIGEPTAYRAVAQACGANPVAIVVPCHRVIAAGGKLGGYHWGVDRKQALLNKERAATRPASEPTPLRD